VPTHGDAHPLNLSGRHGDDVIALDWEQFGFAPTGFDLGYLLIAVDHPDDLLPADLLVRRGAVLTAALTAVSRAAWSLTQPSSGDHLARLQQLTYIVEEASQAE
jgi:aminoglycoside phosphotransferase (APT) family kinase protein